MTYRKISLTLKKIPISEYFIKIYNLGMKLCFEVTTSKSMEKTICRKTPIPSKYFDVPSRISMLFRLISKTNISKRCLMTLTDQTHLKVMASTAIFTIEHILEERSAYRETEPKKKSTVQASEKPKQKVKHLKLATSKPPSKEVESVQEETGSLEEILKDIDAKLDKHKDLERCLSRLKKLQTKYSDDPQILWRIGKAHQKIAEKEKDVGMKMKHVEQGIESCRTSLDMQHNQADAHKWMAILIGYKGQYQSVKEKIHCGKLFKKHLDIAISLNPSDPVLQHMAGRFCLEIASLSWIERKIANSVFSDPLNCSIEIAMNHFVQAEKLMGKEEWKENKLFIAKCHIQEEEYKKALEWLDKAKKAKDDSAGESVKREIEQLLKKYSKYR
ncbi:regulator of microtubule dynamics protein 1-like [Harmonia axyridis]|uniref:regulator of microtubule dynamics protein 1-like n=1 Tax=Harmonia axyridis TaxID=115357 RepID=UPI001E2783B1|nr:regulator of microtubule dynamics protein 1-like [Harmonia axyridis]